MKVFSKLPHGEHQGNRQPRKPGLKRLHKGEQHKESGSKGKVGKDTERF